MKKHIYFILLINLFCFAACSKEQIMEVPQEQEKDPPTGETPGEIEFRTLVYIDEASVNGHLGGSERVVKSRMNELFRKVSGYWNECSKTKLKYTYKYSVADMIVYSGSSQNEAFRKKVYDDPLDFNKYDVVVLFDCKQDFDETGNGGAAAGGGKDHRTVVTVTAGSTLKDIFNNDTYQTLVHEFGHYRGITDLYQYIIDAKDNPVSKEAFEAPKCVMNWSASGEWSEYAINCLNLSGASKQIGKDFPDFFGMLYPNKIEYNITINGVAKPGVDVLIFGSRAGAKNRNRDIWPEAFLEKKTDRNGKVILEDLKQYFIPDRNKYPNLPKDLPYGRWFGFLAKITDGNKVKYHWLPEWECQMPFFKGEKIQQINIEL